MSDSLLPQQPAPVTPKQAALTERYLWPAEPELMQTFLALRRQADAVLAPRFPMANGKPWPLGRCDVITQHVQGLLATALRKPDTPGLKALSSFVLSGGVVRTIWGALREKYFQNAFQFGSIYLDVSNDTVDTKKPPVEILPLAEAQMAEIADPAHFVRIASSYWGAAAYANHVIPSLAPVLPIITVVPGQVPTLQSACDYMIDKFRRDGFASSEAWLAEAEAPPDDVIEALRSQTPAAMRPADPAAGRSLALEACRAARAANRQHDVTWRDSRVLDYLKIRPGAAAGA
ncbi:hypothetical protein [Ferrovibrio sp.]|uniref:hypothetical protein n=1 Tax=Ferrovibrio sp. TaxID=1917215 RepID=UPI003D0D7F7E